MTARGPDQFYADLSAVMRQAFPDRDFCDPVAADTKVFADLGLASIEVVVLAEKLEAFYGRKLPFGPWLNQLRTSGADDLELGALVAFLQKHIN